MSRIFVRVDDFPAWTESMDAFVPAEAFAEFDAIARHHGIPYLLAVTPQPALSPLEPGSPTRFLTDDERDMLDGLGGDRVSWALHGVTHGSRTRGSHNEFAGLDENAFRERIRYGLSELQRQTGHSAHVFVPPFNRIDPRQFRVLTERFEVICGGPESAAIVESRETPGTRYFPSTPPWYGRASGILEAIRCAEPEPDDLCITLHWEWERRTGYSHTASLFDAIRKRVFPWKQVRRA